MLAETLYHDDDQHRDLDDDDDGDDDEDEDDDDENDNEDVVDKGSTAENGQRGVFIEVANEIFWELHCNCK